MTAGDVETVEESVDAVHGPVIVGYVRGDTASEFAFGRILAIPVFTICSLTRYTGAVKGRILNGDGGLNWLHGHWSGRAGVALYGSWRTASDNNVSPVTDWVNSCGQNGAPNLVLVNGVERQTASGGVSGVSVGVNRGTAETSEWGVAEVITWDRALNAGEMAGSSAYVGSLLLVGNAGWWERRIAGCRAAGAMCSELPRARLPHVAHCVSHAARCTAHSDASAPLSACRHAISHRRRIRVCGARALRQW